MSPTADTMLVLSILSCHVLQHIVKTVVLIVLLRIQFIHDEIFYSQQRDNDSVSGESGDEVDPFNDPDDKWEKDFKIDSSSNRFLSVDSTI